MQQKIDLGLNFLLCQSKICLVNEKEFKQRILFLFNLMDFSMRSNKKKSFVGPSRILMSQLKFIKYRTVKILFARKLFVVGVEFKATKFKQ